MRKTYAKPELYAETFAMLEHIAYNCAIEGSNSAGPKSGLDEDCWFSTGSQGGFSFFTSNINCETNPSEFDETDVESMIICYTMLTPEGGGHPFAS